MAVITPNTDVILLKSPLELSDDNQLTFANATAQYNYFYGLPKRAFDQFTYQRKDGTISIPAAIDDIWQYNYVMYRNTNYSNKWFYAYITGYQMESNSVTTISIKTDVYQTWMFELQLKQSFVEREHVNDDTKGNHTLPEDLEIGDYLIDSNTRIDLTNPSTGGFMVCFMCTKKPYESAPDVYLTYGTGEVFSGMFMFATGVSAAKMIVDLYNQSSYTTTNAIVNMYMIPEECVDMTHYSNWNPIQSGGAINIYEIKEDPATLNVAAIVEQPNFGGYVPKNNKMYVWPYKYFHVTNNAGTDIEYRWEDFALNSSGHFQADMTIKGLPVCGTSSKLTFNNYKGYNTQASGHTQALAYGIAGAKLPTCAWTTDYYTNWLTQNGVSIAVNAATTLAGVGLGIATAGAGTGIAAGLISVGTQVGKTLAATHKAATTPDQARGDTSLGDILYATQKSAFNAYGMRIRREYAEIIDNYFSMYGYKVNVVKLPNVTGRANWNYVKTVGCYLAGDIPQEDLAELKSMFDKGITFWHNPATFCDYSQSNAIVS